MNSFEMNGQTVYQKIGYDASFSAVATVQSGKVKFFWSFGKGTPQGGRGPGPLSVVFNQIALGDNVCNCVPNHIGCSNPSQDGTKSISVVILDVGVLVNNRMSGDDYVCLQNPVIGAGTNYHGPDRLGSTCTLSVKGLDADSTFVLTNPDGHIQFSTDGSSWSNQLSLDVGSGDTTTAFRVAGLHTSGGIGDTSICVHKDSSQGKIFETKTLTVFAFKPVSIVPTPGSEYVYAAGRYAPSGDAITVDALVNLLPSGADTTAPEIAKMRVGINQNAEKVQFLVHYSNPLVSSWNVGAASGTKGYALAVKTFEQDQKSLPVNDSDSGSDPLYDPSTRALPGATATLTDSPQKKNVRAPGMVKAEMHDASNAVVGEVAYSGAPEVDLHAHFYDWSGSVDIQQPYPTSPTDPFIAGSFCPLQRAAWGIDVDSSKTNQKAVKEAENAHVLQQTLVGPPYGNDNFDKEFVQKSTTEATFTKP